MGCEGGVTLYDADAIEAHFGPGVWERSGWGVKWHMPIVAVQDGHRVCVTDWNSCADIGDKFEDAAFAFGGRDWAFGFNGDLDFAIEVAKWAVANALLGREETWT